MPVGKENGGRVRGMVQSQFGIHWATTSQPFQHGRRCLTGRVDACRSIGKQNDPRVRGLNWCTAFKYMHDIYVLTAQDINTQEVNTIVPREIWKQSPKWRVPSERRRTTQRRRRLARLPIHVVRIYFNGSGLKMLTLAITSFVICARTPGSSPPTTVPACVLQCIGGPSAQRLLFHMWPTTRGTVLQPILKCKWGVSLNHFYKPSWNLVSSASRILRHPSFSATLNPQKFDQQERQLDNYIWIKIEIKKRTNATVRR